MIYASTSLPLLPTAGVAVSISVVMAFSFLKMLNSHYYSCSMYINPHVLGSGRDIVGSKCIKTSLMVFYLRKKEHHFSGLLFFSSSYTLPDHYFHLLVHFLSTSEHPICIYI